MTSRTYQPGDRGQRYQVSNAGRIVGWTNHMEQAIRLASPDGKILDRETGQLITVEQIFPFSA